MVVVVFIYDECDFEVFVEVVLFDEWFDNVFLELYYQFFFLGLGLGFSGIGLIILLLRFLSRFISGLVFCLLLSLYRLKCLNNLFSVEFLLVVLYFFVQFMNMWFLFVFFYFLVMLMFLMVVVVLLFSLWIGIGLLLVWQSLWMLKLIRWKVMCSMLVVVILVWVDVVCFSLVIFVVIWGSVISLFVCWCIVLVFYFFECGQVCWYVFVWLLLVIR